MTDVKTQYEQTIRQMVPISGLSPKYQDQLIQRSRILQVRKGRFVFKQGDRDGYSFYLLSGEMEMQAGGQTQNTIRADSDSARYPLAQLQPRQFSALARSAATILQVDRSAMDKLLVFDQKDRGHMSADQVLVEVSGIEDGGENDWMTSMLQSQLFSQMPTANIHQLFAALEPVQYNTGESVVQQGEPGDYYYIIQEGRCEVLYRTDGQSGDIRLAELKPGDGFGEEALLSGATRNATIRMLSDGIVMRLTEQQFMELIKKPALKSLTWEQTLTLTGGNVVWLDVRLVDEYRQSHIKNSKNLPLAELRACPDTLTRDKTYVVYCDSGGRSSVAAFLLMDRGFDVSYLEGGLMNCPPDVLAEGSVATPQADRNAADKLVDAEVMASAYRAEVAVAAIASQGQPDTEAADAEREQLNAARRLAEHEAEQKRQAQESHLAELKAHADRQLRQQKKKLEAIYARNAQEMSKLQELKQKAQEQIRAAHAKAEAESTEAQRRMREADEIKKQLEEARARIEQEAAQQREEQSRLEQQLQEQAKQKLEAERRRLAEQFQRNNDTLEQAQRERAAAEAARRAATEEAERIIAEYKEEHARTRAEEEARLKAEREKLEQEAQQIRASLDSIRQAKEEAEAARQAAEEQIRELQASQAGLKKAQAATVQAQIEAAEAEAQQASRELEQARQAQQQVEAARAHNVRDLAHQSEVEDKLRKDIEAEVSAWLEENQLAAPSQEALEQQAEHMRRIKVRAETAKQEANQAARSLLDEISSQLDQDD